MDRAFQPGDFLVFQIESGFGLLRILGIDEGAGVWHISVYRDLFQEVDFAELALGSPQSLTVEIPHIAITDRAFESTQVAWLGCLAVNADEAAFIEKWDRNPSREVSDRSIRLTLGLR